VSAKAAEFKPPAPEQPCPCGTGRSFGVCCLPLHRRERPAASAEELMRSRFTAHVVRDWEHLHRTYLESSREPYDPQDDPQPTEWTRLQIHAHEPGGKPDVATVDFTAWFREGDAEKPLHEKAEFHRLDGDWIYVKALRNGPAPVRAVPAAAGRNDPCPCGSGKKFKKCCGR
jgi:SEC-C motif-containing protein